MPDRIVRAKILTSDAVNLLSWPAEVFYRRLMSVADDYGRYDARPAILRSSLYSLRLDKVSDADIVKWLSECSKAGLVSVYQVEQKEYVEILKFGQRLRAMKSQYPPPKDGKPIEPVNIRGQLPAADNISGQMLLEEKGRESEEETKEKGREDLPLFTIEHCKTLALNDDRWVSANKTNAKELDSFNALLTRRGHYYKNPGDYKSHFANWKLAGKKDSDVKELPRHQQSTGNPPLKTLN